jgi:pimeloyl-ACP methyl ester carboxylesterase
LHDCLHQWQDEAQRGELVTKRYCCRYFVWGEGPPLVFIPGLSSDALSFVMPMARLKRDFCCIAYDLPTGVDDGARLATYRHNDLRDDLLALIDHLNIRQTNLLGYSFGSTIALAALAQVPERFARTILMGGFARRTIAPAEKFLAHWARYWHGPLGNFRPLEALIRRNHYAPFAGRPEENWRFFVEQNAAPAWRTLAHRALLMHQTDLRPLLPRIEAPVLLVYGDGDPLVHRQVQEELQRGLANVPRAEIEECGHQPQLTHPEVLSELIEQFLVGEPALSEPPA